MAEIKQKDKDTSFAQTWQESVTPETQDPMGRVVTMLERQKVEDSQEYYISWLKKEKVEEEVDRHTLRDLSKAEADYEKRPMMVTPVRCLTGVGSWRNICQDLSVKRSQMMQ